MIRETVRFLRSFASLAPISNRSWACPAVSAGNSGLFSQLEKDRLEGAKPITPRQLPRMAARHNRFCANGEPEAGDKLREGMESLRS